VIPIQIIRTTSALVVSRIRFDRKRHLAAVAAVAILMATFLTFNALAAGMQDGLRDALSEGDHHQIQVSISSLTGSDGMDEATFQQLASRPGVVDASARSVKGSGLGVREQPGPGDTNLTFEIMLVGIDPVVEQALVVEGTPGTQAPSPFTRGGYQGRNYTLMEGSWIQGRGDAVVTQTVAQSGYGVGAQVPTSEGNYTVVGIIASAPPFTVPGVIPAGHILVDRTTQDWPTINGAFFSLEPEFSTIQAFAQELISSYPAATGSLRADMAELERQHFEEARTQQVLQAAGRLVALAGAATVFAMSLFLLIGERKSIATMAAVGFSRIRLSSYMNQKMLLIAVLGAMVGGVLGWVAVALIPVPALSFSATTTINLAVFGVATLQTLSAALAGSLIAYLMTIRKDPIHALHVTE